MTNENEPTKELTQEEIWKKYGPIGSANAPPPEVLEERRKPQYIIDPKDVSQTEDIRVRSWAHAKISKYESKLHDKWKQNEIVASGDVEPEDIDIRSVYSFKDMHWLICRQDGSLVKGGPKQMLFHVILTAKSNSIGATNQIILCKVSFAKI